MWVFGYTLDNLSLMALTIAVGFVVDDAIVDGWKTLRAISRKAKSRWPRLQGRQGNRLHHCFDFDFAGCRADPLLLMGGIIGRLFREFAVTLAMTIFRLDGGFADADADDGLALPRAHSETKHGRFYQWSERAFDAMLHAYERASISRSAGNSRR